MAKVFVQVDFASRARGAAALVSTLVLLGLASAYTQDIEKLTGIDFSDISNICRLGAAYVLLLLALNLLIWGESWRSWIVELRNMAFVCLNGGLVSDFIPGSPSNIDLVTGVCGAILAYRWGNFIGDMCIDEAWINASQRPAYRQFFAEQFDGDPSKNSKAQMLLAGDALTKVAPVENDFVDAMFIVERDTPTGVTRSRHIAEFFKAIEGDYTAISQQNSSVD